MEKYYRDVAMYKTHIAAQWDVTFGSLSRFHFGQPLVLTPACHGGRNPFLYCVWF